MSARNLVYRGLAALLLGACQAKNPTCPPEEHQMEYLAAAPTESVQTNAQDRAQGGTKVEIGGRLTDVDQIVNGPLCHAAWSGAVYVGCDVQVVRWEEDPLFLRDCDFSVAPGSVVYVAAHNDAAYYNGCSCHTGE